MKIVFVINSLGLGGAERILYDLTLGLSKEGIEIIVVNLSRPGFYSNRLRDHNITVIDLGVYSGFRRLFKSVRLAHVLYKLQPSLVHTWLYKSDLLAGAITKYLLKVPVIWGIYAGRTNRNLYNIYTYSLIRLCAHFSTRIPSKIISCSAFGRRTHIKIGYSSSKIVYIPSGFAINNCNSRDNTRAKNSQCPIRFGMLGRITTEKDHTLLITAISELTRKTHNLELVLAGGTGVDLNNNSLVFQLADSGILDSTTLMGNIETPDEFYDSIDIFCLISKSEGFPTVVGEAMAKGLPCIVSDIGDARILLDDKTQLVAPENLNELLAAIEHFMRLSVDERSTIGIKNKQRIDRHFSLNRMVRRYKDLYSDVLPIDAA